MKKFCLYSFAVCIALLTGCDKDPVEKPEKPGEGVELLGGAVVVINQPTVEVEKEDEDLSESPITRNIVRNNAPGIVRMDGSGAVILTDYEYNFRQTHRVPALSVQVDGKSIVAQASHIKVYRESATSGYVFASFNNQHDGNYGGVVLFKYGINPNDTENPVTFTVHAQLEMKNPEVTFQVNAIDYNPTSRVLYIAGATEEPGWFDPDNEFNFDETIPALLMAVQLRATDMKFRDDVDPKVVQLGSYQATSIRYFNNKVYATSGDNTSGKNGRETPGTGGGLFVLDATTLAREQHFTMDDARAVTVDQSGVYVMQGPLATVVSFNHAGARQSDIYTDSADPIQTDAKAEILAWNPTSSAGYLFLAKNHEGMDMIKKNNGEFVYGLLAPNVGSGICETWDRDNFTCRYLAEDVTNSMFVNDDVKRLVSNTGTVKNEKTNLLFLANGRQGLYWYEIDEDDNGDYIISPKAERRILSGEGGKGSINHVESRDNIVFVACGLDGVRVLYMNVGFDDPPTGCQCGEDCTCGPDCTCEPGDCKCPKGCQCGEDCTCGPGCTCEPGDCKCPQGCQCGENCTCGSDCTCGPGDCKCPPGCTCPPGNGCTCGPGCTCPPGGCTCNCTCENCTCGDNCTCTPGDCKCPKNCTCGDNCTCGEGCTCTPGNCQCPKGCQCGDKCTCGEGCECTPGNCKCPPQCCGPDCTCLPGQCECTPDNCKCPPTTPSGPATAQIGFGLGGGLLDTGVAIDKDGRVWVWGFRGSGQQGRGTNALGGNDFGNTDPPAPAQLASGQDLTGIVSIAGGAYHILALHENGTLYGWGLNNYGTAGVGRTGIVNRPTVIMQGSKFLQVVAGEYFGVALRDDGTVWSWGNSTFGQTGRNTSGTNNSPGQVTIPNGEKVRMIGGAYQGAWAITENGNVYAWGDNEASGLGFSGTIYGVQQIHSSPRAVPNLRTYADRITYIAGGNGWGQALLDDGTVIGWGVRASLGIGTEIASGGSATVITIPLASKVKQLYSRYVGSIALLEDGRIAHWGQTTGSAFPGIYGHSVTYRTPPSGQQFAEIGGGKEHIYYVTNTGRLYGVGYGAARKLNMNSAANINSWPGHEVMSGWMPNGTSTITFDTNRLNK